MGWREAVDNRVEDWMILRMPPADRIALARELLAGTGRVVAREVATEVLARAIHEGLGGDGWAYNDYGMDEFNTQRAELDAAANACRAAMLEDS